MEELVTTITSNLTSSWGKSSAVLAFILGCIYGRSRFSIKENWQFIGSVAFLTGGICLFVCAYFQAPFIALHMILFYLLGLYIGPPVFDLFWSNYHYNAPLRALSVSNNSLLGPSLKIKTQQRLSFNYLQISFDTPEKNYDYFSLHRKHWKLIEERKTVKSDLSPGLTSEKFASFSWALYYERSYLKGEFKRFDFIELDCEIYRFPKDKEPSDVRKSIISDQMYRALRYDFSDREPPTCNYEDNTPSKTGLTFTTISLHFDDRYALQYRFLILELDPYTYISFILFTPSEGNSEADFIENTFTKNLSVKSGESYITKSPETLPIDANNIVNNYIKFDTQKKINEERKQQESWDEFETAFNLAEERD